LPYLGVGTKELGPQYAQALALNKDLKRGIIIHSSLGVDELCTQGETYVWVVEQGTVTPHTWSPKDFGLQEHPMDQCAGTVRTSISNILFVLPYLPSF
jgi:anthranilate phosphoribosyltransferase